MKYQALTFDLWNTLFDPGVNLKDIRIERTGFYLARRGFLRPFDRIAAQYKAASERFGKTWLYDHRNVPISELVRMILHGLDVPEEPVTIAELTSQFEDTILVNPPGLLDNAAAVLKALSQHCLLGLVCDTGLSPGRVLRKVLELHDVLRFFTCTTFSDEIGVTKPEAVVFNRTLERLGVAAESAAHIGDLLDTDIAGAKAVGMDAIWVNREGGNVDLRKTESLPDWQIKDLNELLALIPK